MPHLHRFYHEATPPLHGAVLLDREESHHAMRVLRVRTGDDVELFNGRGYAWLGTIAGLSRNEVSVDIVQERFVPRPAPEVTLAQAWLHREKLLDELVRQATVFGAARIQFFRADHSEKQPRRSDKWERLAIEACKQCGRLWLPAIEIFDSTAALLDAASESQVVVASMTEPRVPIASIPADRPLTYMVGPEGDFSDGERARAHDANAIPIGLGAYTLRSETAAIAGLTLLQHHLGHLG